MEVNAENYGKFCEAYNKLIVRAETVAQQIAEMQNPAYSYHAPDEITILFREPVIATFHYDDPDYGDDEFQFPSSYLWSDDGINKLREKQREEQKAQAVNTAQALEIKERAELARLKNKYPEPPPVVPASEQAMPAHDAKKGEEAPELMESAEAKQVKEKYKK